MKQSRTLLPDNYRLASAKDDTYGFYAKQAIQKEKEGKWSAAEALWIKAKHRAKKPKDYNWAYERALFCKTRLEREQPFKIKQEEAAA